MKTKLLCIAFICLILNVTTLVAANENQCFSYQGYAVDVNGQAINAKEITIRVTLVGKYGSDIKQTYSETHNVSTDVYGVFNVNVGCGSVVTGSQVSNFSSLYFDVFSFSLKVEVKAKGTDDGTYSSIYDDVLQTVPYARSAGNGVPVGTILSFAGPALNVPAGYIVCDGRSISATDYPALFAAIGNAWGGNSASFNVPDLRGYFLRGIGDNNFSADSDKLSRTSKNTGGNDKDKVGSYQDDVFKGHNHNFTGTQKSTSSDGNHYHLFADVTSLRGNGIGNTNGGDGDADVVNATNTTGSHTHTYTPAGTISSTGGTETRPKNAYVQFIIKAQ